VRSALPLLIVFALAGCHRDIRNESAVRQGVLDYLSTRQNLNVSSMNIDVASVVFRKDEADATVSFWPKGSSTANSMTIQYVLQRKGDRWVVKERVNSGRNPHGAMGGNPHGGGMAAPRGTGSGTLPPGHPAIPER
jgi:hypothetical protein